MHIKVFTKAKCFAMHMMTWQVLVFKTPEVLQERWSRGVRQRERGSKHWSRGVRQRECGSERWSRDVRQHDFEL